ncbi:hypothetical protein [Arvimicrobium flavum]|uniref:hypothetical protein n=1 Tax=Arvimicrobium flavum TaxID=3393320 RepID=UPI00237A692D|nr:hypothetical protein [Mesorhizobium shangrilense]
MNKRMLAYVVYAPPAKGLPFLAVSLAPDGSVVAKAFDTAEEASAYNSEMARSRYAGGVKH